VGNVTSNTAVFLPVVPLVLTSPSNVTVASGGNASFSVVAVGVPTLSYQWELNGVALSDGGGIAGSANSTLTITKVRGNDTGNYTVVVSNSSGNTTSGAAVLSVSPGLTQVPQDTTVTVGQGATLTVGADGSGNLGFQWFYNGTALVNGGNISGVTTPVLNIGDAQAGNQGNYTVKITNTFGNTTSGVAVLTVLGLPSNTTGLDWRQMQGPLEGAVVAVGGNATTRYVAVGDGGTILTSPDGASWTLRATGTTEQLLGAAVGVVNGTAVYVAVGVNGTMLESPNGISWVPEANVTASNLRGVIFADSKFVAFGDSGVVLVSPDGANWTTSNTQTANSILGLSYVASPVSLFVAVGQAGTFLTSPDGVNWAVGQTGVTANLNGIVLGNGLFVAVGDSGTIVTASFGASNGGNWQTRVSGTANSITSVVFTGTEFVGVTSSSETVESADGINWVRGDTGAWTQLAALVYDSSNNLFVGVGGIGINPQNTSYIVTSTDGVTWNNVASANTLNLNDVATGLGQFVVVGGNEDIETSPDGAIWNVRAGSINAATLNAVAFGGNEFVTVGNQNPITGNATTDRSFDAINWQRVATPTANALTGVALGTNSTWVAVGGSATEPSGNGSVVLTSSNQAASWTLNRMTFDTPFLGLAYDSVNKFYIAILGPSPTSGPQGYSIASSPDGLNWTFITSSIEEQLVRVRSYNGYDVAVGDKGDVFVIDPVAQVVTRPFVSTANLLDDVAYGTDANGVPLWVVVGADSENDVDAMFTNTAPDPATSSWKSLNPQALSGLDALAYMNGTFVTVGLSGEVYAAKAWPPSLTAPVADQGAEVGGNVILTVQALPTQPPNFLTFQWQAFNGTAWNNLVNGGAFSNVTTALLGVANVTAADEIPYRVLVTAGTTQLISNNATIVLGTPPVISEPPVNTGAILGGSASFSVVASGNPALSYAWSQNGVPLSDTGGNIMGSNTSTLVLTNIQLANVTVGNSAGTFTVTVSNLLGTASASANLTVGAAPVIVTEPVSQNPVLGGNVVFQVSANATPAPTYQWYNNGVAVTNGARITGAQGSQVSITNVQLSDFGNYTVTVTNSVGNVTSTPAVFLPVVPLILASPANATVISGGNASFTVSAVGVPTLTYQWYVNGVALSDGGGISGSGNSTLTLTGVRGTSSGNYDVVVANGGGSNTSAGAFLSVSPGLTVAPHDTTVTAGQDAVLTVGADGSGNLTYQWYFNGTALTNNSTISGVNTPVLDIGDTVPGNTGSSGNYSVKISNTYGNITTEAANLTVLPLPTGPATGLDWRPMQQPLNGVTVAAVSNTSALYVAVGNQGTILTSPDGGNWSIRSSGSTSALNGVAYGNTGNLSAAPLYVAVGAGGLILESADGQSWVPESSPTISNLNGIIFADNQFVAFGDGGIILTSSDGMNWSTGATGTSGSVRSMSYLPSLSLFVAVGDGGLFLTSPDGINWTLGQTGAVDATGEPVNLNAVAYGVVNGQGLFVAAGDEGVIVTASFGASFGGNWQERVSGTANSITSMIFDGANFIGVTSSSEIVVSPDGVNWARADTGHLTDLRALIYNPPASNITTGLYVAVGNIGIDPLGTDYILTSTDSVTWTGQASAVTVDLTSVADGLGLFAAVGDDEVIETSPDGTTWNVRSSVVDGATLNAVGFGGNEFVTVGQESNVTAEAVSYRSFDGVHWQKVATPTLNAMTGVVYGANATWVAAGDSQAEPSGNGSVVLTSNNQAETWTLNRMGFDNPFLGLAYDAGAKQYVAILGPSPSAGLQGYLIGTSPDGLNWTFIAQTQDVLVKVKNTHGYDIVVGASGDLFVVDPVQGVVTRPFVSTANTLRDAVYGTDANGTPLWLVEGDDLVNDIDAMFTNIAPDPATSSWNSLNPQTLSGLVGLDYFNSTFVSVGANGEIYAAKAWPPSFAAQVANQSAVLAGNATFTVQALPSQPPNFLTYQWQSFNDTTSVWSNLTDNASYSGVTTPLMTVTNITDVDLIPYRVEVTGNVAANTSVTLFSNQANLTLGVAPVITVPPNAMNTTVGGNATFTVVATGNPGLTYVWRRNGVALTDSGGNVSGSNTSTLVLSNLQLANDTIPNSGGNFSITVSNLVGAVTASTTLTVGAPPTIVNQPINESPAVGGNVTFVVSATGSPAPTYQWYMDGQPVEDNGRISGNDTNQLTINPVQTSDFGNYSVVVSNSLGNVTSNAVTLSVNSPLSFTTQPKGGNISAGQNFSFSATVVGSPPPVYQWFHSGAAVPNSGGYSGATTPTLSISKATSTQGGTYYLQASNSNQTIASNTVTLFVGPQITKQPVSVKAPALWRVNFSVTVMGTSPITYQWYYNNKLLKNSQFVQGSTTHTLTITQVRTSNIGSYYVIAKNPAGSVRSSTVTLAYKQP
jgi:hypothetical protein